MQLSLIPIYHKQTDNIEVRFFKQDEGIQYPISSGSISLLQNGQLVCGPIEVVKGSKFVSFSKPKSIYGLTVLASIDSLESEVEVKHLKDFDTSINTSTPMPDEEFLMREPERVNIDTTKPLLSPVVVNIDFTNVPNLIYSGGNRYIFDYENLLIHQPLDTLVPAPKYSELGTVNLLGPIELVDLFEYDYIDSAVNQYETESEFGYKSLLIRCLGSSSGNNTESRSFKAKLKNSAIKGKTAQLMLSFSKRLQVKDFFFTTEILDENENVLETVTQTLKFEDFYNSYGLISQTMTYEGGLRFFIEVPNLFAGDVFDIEILMPQVTSLNAVSTYTDETRLPDIYKVPDLELNSQEGTIELVMNSGNNDSGVLFDLGSIKSYYDGQELFFNINGSVISSPVVLKDNSTFRFTYSSIKDLFSIESDGIPLATGSGFTFEPNSDLYIGSDSDGNNQLNARLVSFKILRY